MLESIFIWLSPRNLCRAARAAGALRCGCATVSTPAEQAPNGPPVTVKSAMNTRPARSSPVGNPDVVKLQQDCNKSGRKV
ncbi:hypothetical protein [Altererythrobacter palmitatis]|uniref:hypothetical protein n=1 Tax=Alteraurantiacibacter palmitatis TaxID=2054628 RepID=UPI003016DB08